MNRSKITLFIFLMIVPVIGNEADEILTKVMNRLQGVDRSLVVKLFQEQKGKPTKEKVFHSWTHWNQDGEIRKMVKIQIEKPKDLSGTCYWMHEDLSENEKKWMTMPITGKLKDITNTPIKKGEFNFSELEISKDDIENHSNRILGEELVNNRETVIVESIEYKSSGQIKLVKNIWIDKKDNFIHKAIFKNQKDRVIKQISLRNLEVINDIPVMTNIKIQNFRKKMNIQITFSDISFESIQDIEIFNPTAQ